MQIENKVFWDVSETLLQIRRNERLSSIWWLAADTRKERESNQSQLQLQLLQFYWIISTQY